MSSSRAKQNRPGRRLTAVYRRGFEDGRRAALEAALSAAEPEMNNAGSKCEPLERSCTFDPDNDPKKENVYRAPPAPSVAVKALEALPGITGFGASFNRDKDAWVLYTTPSCDRFGQIDGFNPKVIDWILEVLRSALSSQVQDESEIVDCLLAGKPFVFDPATNFCHADDGGAPEHCIKYVPAAQVQDVTDSAFQAIADERLRQIGKGYDAAHDDRHVAGEIISATWGASARLLDAQECAVSGDIAGYKKYLIQAAAQIVAEYGRVERAAAPAKQEGQQ